MRDREILTTLAGVAQTDYGINLKYYESLVYWGDPNGPFNFLDLIHAQYIPVLNTIEVFEAPGSRCAAVLTTAMIAHELGHHIDWQSMDTQEYRANMIALRMKEAIRRDSSKWPTLRKLVFNMEDRAWCNAFDILKKIGFDEWEKFFTTRDWALGTYKSVYGVR